MLASKFSSHYCAFFGAQIMLAIIGSITTLLWRDLGLHNYAPNPYVRVLVPPKITAPTKRTRQYPVS